MGGIVAHNAIRGLGQNCRTCGHGLEKAVFLLVAEVNGAPLVLGDKTSEAFGLMHVQVGSDTMPPRHLGIRGDQARHMGYEAFFGSSWP